MLKDISRQKFNMLIATRYIKTDNERRSWWLCKCECGKEKIVRLDSLQTGGTSSCGCIYKIHGLEGTRFYRIWRHIKTRCYNSKMTSFHYWGGRGIKVIKRWHNFKNFMNDMYESYLKHCKKFGEKNTTIDRINNNGNYKKSNCRWATYKEQANNRN